MPYPWQQGDELLAADLNAAIANMGDPNEYLNVKGGEMEGPILLAGDATLPLHAVPLRQLNTAIAGAPFLPADGTFLPTSKDGLPPGTYWRNGDFVCIT